MEALSAAKQYSLGYSSEFFNALGLPKEMFGSTRSHLEK